MFTAHKSNRLETTQLLLYSEDRGDNPASVPPIEDDHENNAKCVSKSATSLSLWMLLLYNMACCNVCDHVGRQTESHIMQLQAPIVVNFPNSCSAFGVNLPSTSRHCKPPFSKTEEGKCSALSWTSRLGTYLRLK